MSAQICTFSGLVLNPLNPKLDDILIEDIAHALSLCNRFAGHTKFPISVAQHSVWACRLSDRVHALQALLHDASEAYLGDVTKWLKASAEFEPYRVAERRVQSAIYERFGCSCEEPNQLKRIDNLLVRYEMFRGYTSEISVGHLNPLVRKEYPPLNEVELGLMKNWEPWSWERSESEFLKEFEYHKGAQYGNPL